MLSAIRYPLSACFAGRVGSSRHEPSAECRWPSLDSARSSVNFMTPMPRTPPLNLSRRERQIMDVVYRLGRATAAEVTALLPDPPTYTTVRGLLRILEEKGHLRHE